jgi:hypothetical protein
MSRATQPALKEASEREALRRRVKRMYEWFNQGAWAKCFSLIDPALQEAGKVELPVYQEQMEAFRAAYGQILPWYIRISLHLGPSTSKRPQRPFAYVYVVWQDEARGFHMFKERWVKDSAHWFTRVTGLVPNRQDSVGNSNEPA